MEEAKQSKNTLGLGQTLPHLLVITEEECVVLNIGGQCFATSRVTLWADSSSLIGLLLRKNCPMHPHRNTCFLIGTPVIVPATFFAPPLFLPRHKKWRGIMLYPSTFWVSVRPSAVDHSCPLHSFDTVRDNFTKLGTNIKHDQRTCRDKQRSRHLHFFAELFPFVIFSIEIMSTL